MPTSTPSGPPSQSCSSRNLVPATGLCLYGAVSTKPSSSVQRLRSRHAGSRVEPHASVAEPSCLGDDGRAEPAPEARATRGREHEQPLHLAHVVSERAKSDAAGDRPFAACDEECAARRRIVAGQLRQLTIEALEVELERKRVRVRAQQSPHVVDFGRVHLNH